MKQSVMFSCPNEFKIQKLDRFIIARQNFLFNKTSQLFDFRRVITTSSFMIFLTRLSAQGSYMLNKNIKNKNI